MIADQGAKLWAERSQDGAVDLAHNPAAALGTVQGSATGLTLITLAVLVTFTIVVVPMSLRFRIPTWVPALVIGGGLSNALDRARFGAVRDFIRTPWAIVNVADLCVIAGVSLLVALAALRCRSAPLNFGARSQRPRHDLRTPSPVTSHTG
ncbi:MAG: signal peptidase II [Acidimicrobiia bacterium]|nr:signal peptidase II [Acidimicrobiia bacterium]